MSPYQDAIKSLEKSKTSKGHYKADAVHLLIRELTTTRTCPNCKGRGVIRDSGEFAGPGCDYTCHICDGVGRI